MNDNFYYLSGDSGTGKTTLLELLSGWLLPTKGKIVIKDNITKSKITLKHGMKQIKGIDAFRKQFGIIFQDLKLNENMNVADNVYMYLKIRNIPITKQIKLQAKRYLLELGFTDFNKLMSSPLSSLSGGEKQRIAIVRALLVKPNVLLCDEITSSVGSVDTINIVKMLEKFAVENNAMVLFATHDAQLVKSYVKVSLFLSKTNKSIKPYIYKNGFVPLR